MLTRGGQFIMPKRCLRWIWRHRKFSLALCLLSGLILVNLVAYMHAHAMTHFTPSGSRTQNPEALSTWQKIKVVVSGVNIPRPSNDTDPRHLGLPFETRRFRTHDGVNLEGWYIPPPDPAVPGLVALFHGYSASKASLLREAHAFHELGYATFLIDFRGSGGSDGNDTTIGVAEAEDVERTLDYVRAQWPGQPVVLFGQSMGSAAILRAVALRNIRPDALVLESPFDQLLSTVANRLDSMGLPAFPLAHLLVFWGGVQHGFNGFEHNPVEYAAHVSCPILLLHGKRDRRVTLAQMQAIFEHLGGDKHLETFDNVGHSSYVAAEPNAWQQRVGTFLSHRLGKK
jgi:alpha-beta hydrolase superfamily lysophospholipase